MDDPRVIKFLLSTEIIPLCLRIMETGSELCKTVATFIIQKILLDEEGLSYICATYERFYAVSTVLSNMVHVLVEQPSQRLLKHIVRCYLRLADNTRYKWVHYSCWIITTGHARHSSSVCQIHSGREHLIISWKMTCTPRDGWHNCWKCCSDHVCTFLLFCCSLSVK